MKWAIYIAFWLYIAHIPCSLAFHGLLTLYCLLAPRVELRGLTAFARRNSACVFRKFIHLGHFVISPKYSGTQIISEISTPIEWNLKIQNIPFWGDKFSPPILSPLHSTRGWITFSKLLAHSISPYIVYFRSVPNSPLTEEIGLQISGSPHYPVLMDSLMSDWDSVYSTETQFEILGTPEKTCLIYTGNPVKMLEIWQS